MLAPVLARLSQLPGVISALVDCTGSFFLVTASEAALLSVRDLLGGRVEEVQGAERDRQLAERSRGELWFSAANIRALSLIEGRVLAVRVRDFVATDAGLDGAALLDAIRLEICAALNRAHDEGGRAATGWLWKEWPGIARNIVARLAPAFAPEELGTIESSLSRFPAAAAG